MKKYKKNPTKQFVDLYSQMYPESKKEIRTVTFQVTEDCCLKCSYCYQTNKSRNKMTFDVAKKFVDDLLDGKYGLTTENVAGVIIEFIGGEPLMEIDLISQIVEYIITKMMEINHPWLPFTRFSIPSNGILLQTPKVIDFFDKYHEWCGYGVSIDGNKKLHDSCRVDFYNK